MGAHAPTAVTHGPLIQRPHGLRQVTHVCTAAAARETTVARAHLHRGTGGRGHMHKGMRGRTTGPQQYLGVAGEDLHLPDRSVLPHLPHSALLLLGLREFAPQSAVQHHVQPVILHPVPLMMQHLPRPQHDPFQSELQLLHGGGQARRDAQHKPQQHLGSLCDEALEVLQTDAHEDDRRCGLDVLVHLQEREGLTWAYTAMQSLEQSARNEDRCRVMCSGRALLPLGAG